MTTELALRSDIYITYYYYPDINRLTDCDGYILHDPLRFIPKEIYYMFMMKPEYCIFRIGPNELIEICVLEDDLLCAD